MKYNRPAGLVLAAILFCAAPLCAQHGGGGHSSGGHSGFGGGHSIGHSMGHSFGHVFGHHSGGRGRSSPMGKGGSEAPPLTGAAMVHGKVVQLPNPQGVLMRGRPRFRHAPLTEFAFSHHFSGFAFGFSSFNSFCGPTPRFSARRMLFGGDFDCLQQGFFFDPFFLAGFDPFTLDTWGSGAPFTAMDLADSTREAQLADQRSGWYSATQPDSEPLSQNQGTPPADTLLQFIDGSMYALTSYWLEGDRIHYITSYGGENSVPLKQVDFDKTLQLNAAQGVKLELRPKPSPILHE